MVAAAAAARDACTAATVTVAAVSRGVMTEVTVNLKRQAAAVAAAAAAIGLHALQQRQQGLTDSCSNERLPARQQ